MMVQKLLLYSLIELPINLRQGDEHGGYVLVMFLFGLSTVRLSVRLTVPICLRFLIVSFQRPFAYCPLDSSTV
jgi:hypothetical protein